MTDIYDPPVLKSLISDFNDVIKAGEATDHWMDIVEAISRVGIAIYDADTDGAIHEYSKLVSLLGTDITFAITYIMAWSRIKPIDKDTYAAMSAHMTALRHCTDKKTEVPM